MSADEIRRLAERPSMKIGAYYSPAEKNMIRSALLNFATMVERCEEKIKYLKSIRERGDTEVIDTELKEMNYILKGKTDEH